MTSVDLAEAAIRDDLAGGTEGLVLLMCEASETPLAGDDDLLTSRELVLGATESLEHMRLHVVTRAHREKDLSDVDTSDETVGLAESVTHTGLKTISTGARKHLVDAEHMPRVHTDAEMERLLTTLLGDVLVAGNAGSLQSLRRQLLLLEGDQVDAQREVIDVSLLAAKIVDLDLGVRDTTAEARLDVRLAFADTVAASRTTTHSYSMVGVLIA
mmetsp:Transcript_48643/g.122402  ORF Transcript_48643/g.122402 Transcript_48643/m.122402 type:complete len:214 (-) Transcript_48643:109-750(-)